MVQPHYPPTSIGTYAKLIAAVCGMVIALVLMASVLSHKASAAPTALSPNDIVVVTANSDSGWSTTACTDGAPGGVHSNAIDLLLRKDIGSGTQIKVTDNAWNGSALTTTEGFITYTAATDLPAGTIIRYSDCLYNQGGSGWTRSVPLASFDTAIGGDTLLVYQGTEASPSFIYGFGFRSNSWIASGSPTAANSRIPAALSSASPAAYVALGSTTSSRNYQYVGGVTGIYAANFLANLKVTANWNANGGASAGTPFGPTGTLFDTVRPYFVSVVRQTPATAITNAPSVTFRITASEGVQPLTSSSFSPIVTGSLTYGSVTVSAVNSSVYNVAVTGLSGEGTISLGVSYSGSLIDLNGNLATDTSFTSPTYTRDATDPTVTIDTLITNQSQPALSGSVSEPVSEVVVTVNGVNYTAAISGATWSLPAGTITPALVDGVYDIEVITSDMAGNLGVDTTTDELTVDTMRPAVTVSRAATQPSQTNVDTFTFDVVFSKPVIAGSFTGGDIIISGSTATVTGFVQLSPTTWAVTISGATDDDLVTVSIADGAAQDAAGNSNIASTDANNTVLYDISAPIVTVMSLSTTNASPALRGTVNDPYATITVTVDGIEYPATNDGAGNWSITEGLITPALAIDVYDVSVRATDLAGNIGSDITTNELTIMAQVINLKLTKSTASTSTHPGQQIIYDLLVESTGTTTATDVVVTETVPAHTTYNGIGWTCENGGSAGSTCTYAIGSLASGANQTISFAVLVDSYTTIAHEAREIHNTATVAGGEPNGVETTMADNSDDVTVPLALADIAVTKTDNIDPVFINHNYEYTITVANKGPSDATNIVVRDALPNGISFRGVNDDDGANYCAEATGVITCLIPTLANGDSVVITLEVTGDTPGVITNAVTAHANQQDPNRDDNRDTEETTIDPADLELKKTADKSSTSLNSTVVYILNIINHGPDHSTDTIVTDTLPNGLELLSATATQGFCSISGQSVSCNVGTLNDGASTTVTVVAQANKLGSFTNNASVSSNEYDPNLDNNTAEANILVLPLAPDTGIGRTAYGGAALLLAAALAVFGIKIYRLKKTT